MNLSFNDFPLIDAEFIWWGCRKTDDTDEKVSSKVLSRLFHRKRIIYWKVLCCNRNRASLALFTFSSKATIAFYIKVNESPNLIPLTLHEPGHWDNELGNWHHFINHNVNSRIAINHLFHSIRRASRQCEASKRQRREVSRAAECLDARASAAIARHERYHRILDYLSTQNSSAIA